MLFLDRMVREGRIPEWDAALTEGETIHGKDTVEASQHAMLLMEFVSEEDELQRKAVWQAANMPKMVAQPTFVDAVFTRGDEEESIRDFNNALVDLPDKAAVSTEMDWIRTHPAMVRQSRSSDVTKQVIITSRDILYAPHGKAPSKAAVFALQHWVNHPHEFYKQLLSEQKKKGDAAGANKAEEDLGLPEVERLLKTIQSRRHDASA